MEPMPVIVGVARSGTTLLRLMLDSHPAMAVPSETGFLLPIFEEMRDGRQLSADEFGRVVTGMHTWPDLALDADTFRQELTALDSFSVSEGTRLFYRLYAARHGKTRWADKTPVYVEHLAELEQVLPEARFVHVIRDGRDAAVSVRKTWFATGEDMPSLARGWARQIRAARQAGAGRDNYLEVRYEGLVSDPERVLRRVCRFVDLPFDPTMLEYHRAALARLLEMQDRTLPDGVTVVSQQRRLAGHTLVSQPPDVERIGRWRIELDATEQRQFVACAGDLLEELGYETGAQVTGRRIVLTNCWLASIGGTQTYLRDLGLGLQRTGHEPLLWSPIVGPFCDDLRGLGLRVVDALPASVAEPDIVHCQSHDEALAALSRFPRRPGIYVLHAAGYWQDEPPLHPRLLRYVAVDELCRQRLLSAGIDPQRIVVIPNGIDLVRFGPRAPLPSRPIRALVFSNYASDAEPFHEVAREACARLGIELDVAGAGVGAVMAEPESRLGDYDLVFAKARAALEAMAVGCAVIVMDAPGLAGLVTSDRVAEWRRWNFGRQLLTRPHNVDTLCAEIERYDPTDAARCHDWVRANCGLDAMVAALAEQYEQVIAEWDGRADYEAELVALSSRLALIGPLRDADERNRTRLAGSQSSVQRLRESVGGLQQQISAQRGQVAKLTAARDAAVTQSAADRTAVSAAQQQRDAASAAAEHARLERDAARVDRDAAVAGRDAALVDRDTARADRDAAESERRAAAGRLEESAADLAVLRATRWFRMRAAILDSRMAPAVRAVSWLTRRRRAR